MISPPDAASRPASLPAGAGLAELITPTNGALMAVLLAARVPYQTWVRFLLGGLALMMLVGIVAIAVAISLARA